jgi:hypothetical protein
VSAARTSSPPGWRVVAGAALCYAVATIALTWPLFRHPGTTVLDTKSLYGGASVLIQRDINLSMWALAWGSHALVTDPLRVFHANAFHPAPYTLASSEHMLGNVPLFGPVYLVSRNPILAHQATLLATFVLAGLAMAAAVLYWTGDRPAAFAAGFLYAFAPYRFWQIGNVHVVSVQYLPLVPLAVDMMLDRRGGRWGPVLLAVALVLSSLCSYYIGYAAFVLAGVHLLAGVLVRGRGALRRAVAVAAAAAGAAAVVAVVTVPYLLLQQSGVLPDYGEKGFTGLAFLGMLRHGLRGLLAYYVLPIADGIPEFLGYAVLALAALAVAVRPGHPRGALVAAVLTGVVLGLGPYAITPGSGALVPLPYRALVAIVPGFSAMRVPQRFGVLATLGTVALAALGLAWLRTRLEGRGLRAAAAVLPAVVVTAALLEATPRGLRAFPMGIGPTVPPAYRWLAEHGDGGPLLELPAQPKHLHRESKFMYWSTFHWLPTVNGYSAYPPASYVRIMEAAKGLPAPGALRATLDLVPLRWILLHRGDLRQRDREAWEATLGGVLRRVAEFDGDVLYEVPQEARGP